MKENNNYAVICHEVTKKFRSDTFKGVRNIFKRPVYFAAVNEISFEVKYGEIFGIIGPNGSGKSTIIRMLATLLLPDHGYLKVFGMDVTKNTYEVRSLINRVSVDASFFKKLSVKENLAYAARIYGVPVSKAFDKAKVMLKNFGLDPKKMYSPVEDLSRGQQQMVSIARSFLSSPNLLLLDEPTTGLDPKSKKTVQEFILSVKNDHNTSIILTSHDMIEIEKLCERTAFLKDGKIWACGTSNELKIKTGKDNLEDVFLEVTGEEFPEDESEE